MGIQTMGRFRDIQMSKIPKFKKQAGCVSFGNRLKTGPDVSIGIETEKKEDFLKRIIISSEEYSSFDEIYDDEEEKKLFVNAINEVKQFYRVNIDAISTGFELKAVVHQLYDKVESDISCESSQSRKIMAAEALAMIQ